MILILGYITKDFEFEGFCHYEIKIRNIIYVSVVFGLKICRPMESTWYPASLKHVSCLVDEKVYCGSKLGYVIA